MRAAHGNGKGEAFSNDRKSFAAADRTYPSAACFLQFRIFRRCRRRENNKRIFRRRLGRKIFFAVPGSRNLNTRFFQGNGSIVFDQIRSETAKR